VNDADRVERSEVNWTARFWASGIVELIIRCTHVRIGTLTPLIEQAPLFDNIPIVVNIHVVRVHDELSHLFFIHV
jgi:hypothetical protein